MTYDAWESGEKRPTFRAFAKSARGMSSGEPDERALTVANFARRLCGLMRWYDIRCAREPGQRGSGGRQADFMRAVQARVPGVAVSASAAQGQGTGVVKAGREHLTDLN